MDIADFPELESRWVRHAQPAAPPDCPIVAVVGGGGGAAEEDVDITTKISVFRSTLVSQD